MYEGLAASYARRLPSVALLRRGMRGKPLGFPLKIAQFRRHQLAEKLARDYYFLIASANHSPLRTCLTSFSPMPS